jgi:alkylglycerol monooxygenase
MNPIVFAVPIFFLSIGAEVVAAQWHKKDAYDVADALSSLNLGVVSQLSGFAFKLVSFGIYSAVYNYYHALNFPIHSWLGWAAALLAYDFCYYWVHRTGHEVAILWAGHVVHHSSEFYNLSTALRQSSTHMLTNWIFYLPLALIGVPPAVFITIALIDLLYQFWVHTELVGRLGVLDYIFTTPSNHRVHHGQNDYCIDRNYGGIFIVWDRLFGTFTPERLDEEIVYGVRKPLKGYNPFWGNAHEYAELWQHMRQRRGWGRLSLWFSRPSADSAEGGFIDTAQYRRNADRLSVRQTCIAIALYIFVALSASGFLVLQSSAITEWFALLAAATLMLCGALGHYLNRAISLAPPPASHHPKPE